MATKRWQQIQALFLAAVKQEPSARTAFLDQACADDTTLRQEVESLIEMHESSDHVLDKPVGAIAAKLLAQDHREALSGQFLCHYQVEREIGHGGMGEVYLARDTRLHRYVAIKLLPASFINDTDRVRRFQQEARAASALNHPNIVTIHEVGESDGLRFMVSEYVEGKTLRQMLREAHIRLDKALDIVMQTATALKAAHQAGIAHRDIKPENIMVRPDGYVKVLDFGLAKLTERGHQEAEEKQPKPTATNNLSTETGIVMGTVRYMSPEQARGQKVDRRSDIFSLGVVLYEAITGRMPFEGETASHTVVAILEREPQPISEYVPDAPDELQRIINRALRKPRAERYQTIGEMLDDLKEVREEIVFRARQEWHSGNSGKVTNPMTAVATETRIRQRRIGAILWVTILALTTSALVFGVYKYISARRTPSPLHSVKLDRITANGKIWGAAITRNGKHIAYMAGPYRQQSLWVMQVSTSSNVQIIPPAEEVVYWGLTFSNDGDYIYYVRNVGSGPWELYRVPTIGGTPKRLLVNIDSAVTFSPDGERMAFGRVVPDYSESRLVMANADGSGERVLATRKLPDFFDFQGVVKISWSPDGESIACPAGNSKLPGVSRAEVVEVSVKDGAEKLITRQKWGELRQVAWLGDGRGLVMVAREKLSSPSQIWYLSYPDGEARRLTNDFSNYVDVSVTADSNTLITVQGDRLTNIWVAPEGDAARAKQITDSRNAGRGISWTPDGKVIYGSNVSGNPDIWIMDADGGNQRRLTDNVDYDGLPSVSSDGRYVAFESVREGKLGIWRMDIDGSNPVQLTEGNVEINPCFSPDGRWVYYNPASGNNPGFLWKVPIEGGDPVQVTDQTAHSLAFSPDQKWMVYVYADLHVNPPFGLAIAPVEGGTPVKLLDISPEGRVFCWTPDSRALAYIDHLSLNVWAQPIDGGKPVQLTSFKTDQTFYFAWSRDGKQLALARGTHTSDVVQIRDFK